MRKLINFGAGFTVVTWAIGTVFLIPLAIIESNRNPNASSLGSTIAAMVISVILIVCYYLLMKRLGAWNEAAWYSIGGGRKTALFLLALPGIISAIEIIIFLAIFGVFREVNTAINRAEEARLKAEIRDKLQGF